MKQKVVSVSAYSVEKEMKKHFEDGWIVKSMVAEQVSTSVSVAVGGQTYSSKSDDNTEKGLIVFLLEKQS